jgi:hypothetical protein
VAGLDGMIVPLMVEQEHCDGAVTTSSAVFDLERIPSPVIA